MKCLSVGWNQGLMERLVRNDYFSGLVYFIFLFWVLTKKGAREMKLTTEEIHNIYLHQSGVAEGLLRAGADADFPVMFAEAIIEFYELRKAQDK